METTVSGRDATDLVEGWVLLLTAPHDVRAVPLPAGGAIT